MRITSQRRIKTVVHRSRGSIMMPYGSQKRFFIEPKEKDQKKRDKNMVISIALRAQMQVDQMPKKRSISLILNCLNCRRPIRLRFSPLQVSLVLLDAMLKVLLRIPIGKSVHHRLLLIAIKGFGEAGILT